MNDHHFTPGDADGRYVKVYLLFSECQRETAVLGTSALGDVHLREHFDSVNHRLVDMEWQWRLGLQHAVESEQYVTGVCGRHNVYFRGLEFDRLQCDQLDYLYVGEL